MSADILVQLDVGATQYIVPFGMYGIRDATAFGSGAGGRAGLVLGRGGGGGGSGGYSKRTTFFPVLPGDIFTVVVGVGGLGDLYSSGNSNTAGSLSSLTHVRTGIVLVLANGGAKPTGAGGGTGAVTTGAVGDVIIAGNVGGSSSGTTGADGAAGGAAPNGGAGGVPSTVNTIAPTPGDPPGGGGAGGRGNSNNLRGNGSAGGDGRILITGVLYELVGLVG